MTTDTADQPQVNPILKFKDALSFTSSNVSNSTTLTQQKKMKKTRVMFKYI